MKSVNIYTDGACSGNPGPGGWGTILEYNGHEKVMSGYEPETTNNRMEIFAAIKGLEALRQPCKVTVYSDSSYLVNTFRKGWIANWQMGGWKTASKNPVENQDLWQRLLKAVQIHSVDWVHVKGHADHAYNNRCDKLATDEIKNNKEQRERKE